MNFFNNIFDERESSEEGQRQQLRQVSRTTPVDRSRLSRYRRALDDAEIEHLLMEEEGELRHRVNVIDDDDDDSQENDRVIVIDNDDDDDDEEERNDEEEEEEEDEDTSSSEDPSIVDKLSPIPVRLDYASGDNLQWQGDIDSILVCARTPLPFTNKRSFTLQMNDNKIKRCRNVKLTSYLCQRPLGRRRPAYRGLDQRTLPDRPWYEFPLGNFAGDPLYVLFQLNTSAGVFCNASEYATRKNVGRLTIARNLFLREVVARAARMMSIESNVARTGLPWKIHLVEDTYNIPHHEWPEFASNMAEIMTNISLPHVTGMGTVRFYRCQHGTRTPRQTALEILEETATIEHAHIDVVQVHVADEVTKTET